MIAMYNQGQQVHIAMNIYEQQIRYIYEYMMIVDKQSALISNYFSINSSYVMKTKWIIPQIFGKNRLHLSR